MRITSLFKMESTNNTRIKFIDKNHYSAVTSSLNEQRSSSKLCDVLLRVSATEIFAHSCVLAAASPYFDTLFSGQDLPRSFSQKTPQIIDIHIDVENDTGYGMAVKHVIDFMYTSQIELASSSVPQVKEIASIMQMPAILGFCDTFGQRAGFENVKELVEIDLGDKIENEKATVPCIYSLPEEDTPDINDALSTLHNVTSEEKEIADVNQTKASDNSESQLFVKRAPFLKKADVKQDARQEEVVVEKKKRGRPKKVIEETVDEVTEIIDPVTGLLIAIEGVQNNKENTEANADQNRQVNKCLDDNAGGSTNDEDIKGNVTKKKHETPVQRVSRSGRVIKPKLFSDDMITTFKQEIDVKPETNKDFFEALDLEKAAVKDEQEADEEDEISDPSYVHVASQEKKHDDENITFRHDYPCHKCGMLFTKMHDLYEHIREHMHAEKKCSYCGWVCDNDDADFDRHLHDHTDPKPYFCNFCNVQFKTKTQLYLHLPKHMNIKPFVCKICDAGFKWKHALKNHMITHKGTKDYLCDICGFATAHKTLLKSHRLIHTGDTFKCPYEGCIYQATKKTNLKFHLLTHTGEKPYQCEICGTSFSLVKNMKRHMLLHQADRRFKCNHCAFCTTRFDKLKEHYYKQHNIGQKPGTKFTWSEYLRRKKENVSEESKMEEGQEETVIKLEETMETIELEVPVEESGASTTQILNLMSSTGEQIPITITQIGSDISYEIPVHLITQEVTDQ